MTNLAYPLGDSLESWASTTIRLPLGESIDSSALEGLRSHLRKIPLAPRRLSLDCAPVRGIDPVGAALLWLLCIETERTIGTRISLVDLPPAIVQRLRNHPLLEYVSGGDELFEDPFASSQPSAR